MAMARRLRSPQVLLLKKILRAFRKFLNGYKGIGCAVSETKARYFTIADDVVGRSFSALPTDVPKGHCAVYVGSKRSRFIIPTVYLNHSLFRALLEKAEEEYGFDHNMGLTIPCEEVVFEYLTSMLGEKDAAPARLELDEIINFHSQKLMDCSY